MKTTIPRKLALALALAHGLTASLMAQAAPTAPTPAKTEDEPVVLSVFTVNTERDRGYIAVDSLAGGRTNTPIKLTPSSISSLTRMFIDDLGIQNVRDALSWSPNVVPEDPNAGKGFGGSAFHDWAFNYRGAGAGEQGGPGPTRNYFSFYQNIDTYNVERFEFLHGPNSIIFGLGTVGGQLSAYSKVPRVDQNFVKPTVTTDSNRSVRFEVDINRRLSDSVAMRVNAVNDNNNGWRENDVNKVKAADVALLFKFGPNTTLQLEGETAKIHRTLISSTIGDKVSGWDGTTASQTWGTAPTGSARTTPIQNAGAWGDWLNPFWVYIPSLGSKSLMGWAGGYASSGSLADVGQALNYQPEAGWYPAQIKLPWEATFSSTAKIPVRPSRDWTYGSGQSNIDYKDVTVTVHHKFGSNIDFTASAYRYTDTQTAKDYEGTGGAAVDINKQLPDKTANPNYGKAFADFFLSKQVQSRSVTEARAQLNYHFDAKVRGITVKQLFSLSSSAKELKQSARQYLGQVGNGTTITNPADWVQNMIWGRIYLDNPNVVMNAPEVAPNGRAIAYLPKADGYWFDFDDSFKPKDFAIMSQTRFFDDDRLAVTLGARREKYTEHLVELRRGPNLTDHVVDEGKSAETVSAGAVYFLSSGVGLVGNFSKNIQPPHAGSQPLLSGNRPDPERGKGLEYGFRYSSDDGKYYATLIRYDTKSQGHLVENPVNLRAIWQKSNVAQGLGTESGQGNLAFSDTTSLDVTGYEFEITANPTNQLRMQANYGKPDARIVDYYPGSRAYFAANSAAWNAVLNNSALDQAKRNDLRSAMADVQNALDQAKPGARNQGLVDYTASIFANFTFDGEPLKGFSVGAGASFTGRSYAGIYEKQEYFGSTVTNTHMVIAYEKRIHGIPMRLALNIGNVLDKKDPIVTSYHWGYVDSAGTHIRDGYYFLAPRTFRFSARFTF